MIYVYDVEILANFFSVIFKNVKDGSVKEFVLHSSRDDGQALHEFLLTKPSLIGYNCINFDYHLIKEFLEPRKSWLRLIPKLKRIANERIEAEKDFYGDLLIPHRDLMKINHYDSMGRLASLKWLMIQMKFKNVMDMPIHHDSEVNEADIPMVLEYNLNDVEATLELYNRSKDKLRLRKTMSSKYGVDMGNYSDSKMGKHIILKRLSEKTGISMVEIKKFRTPRSTVAIKDCLLPQLRFESPEFKSLLEYFRGLVVNPLEPKLPEIMRKFDCLDYYYGLGGLHASRESGTYSNIHSCDVGGFYPSLVVSQKIAPAQFGVAFTEVMAELAEERKKYPKGTDDNIALKLAQNASIGDLNSEYSAFYDPAAFYSVTLNGQLSLAMLCESLTLRNAATVLMANTDGIEVQLHDEALFYSICKEWEDAFGLSLEHSFYTKISTVNINNYLAVTDKGKVKLKGSLEIDKELHKDNSMAIVPYAIEKYLVDGIPVSLTINNETAIDKFLLGVRAKVGKFELRNPDPQPLSKHVRYYISNSGGIMMKHTEKKSERVHQDSRVTIMNKWVDGPYDIDRGFYIRECNKILYQLKPRKITKVEQLMLF
jgi:hypothetical protein